MAGLVVLRWYHSHIWCLNWKWLQVETWLAPLQPCRVPGYPHIFSRALSFLTPKLIIPRGTGRICKDSYYLDTEVPPHSIGQVSLEGQPRFRKGVYFFSQKEEWHAWSGREWLDVPSWRQGTILEFCIVEFRTWHVSVQPLDLPLTLETWGKLYNSHKSVLSSVNME